MPSRKEKQCFLIPLENMKRYTLLRIYAFYARFNTLWMGFSACAISYA